MPIEVELGIPVSNPLSQSEYSQHLRKAIQKANSLARQQLEKSREQQCTSYDKGHKNWSPFESGQTVWLRRPKSWKFLRKWVGPYNIICRKGVTYNVRSNAGRSLVAHHNQPKSFPLPLDQGQPVHPVPETPWVVIKEVQQVEQQQQNEAQVIQVRDTPRPAHIRQDVNPQSRYGEFLAH